MRSYSIRDAKNRLSALLARVRRGARIVITHRGVPVAMLVPPEEGVCYRQKSLPPSPAVDEALERCEGLMKAIPEALPPGEPPPWVYAADHLAALRRIAPEIQKAAAPLQQQGEDRLAMATRANETFNQALADVTHGNLVCDQIDIIINGLKFCDFYLSLVTTPGKFFEDWAKENVPAKLLGMIPAVRRTPATQQAVESTWKGIVTFSPSRAKLSGADVTPFGVSSVAPWGPRGPIPWATSARGMSSAEAFRPCCSTCLST